MNKLLRLFLLIVFTAFPARGICQESEGVSQTFSKQGIVTQVDSIASLLIVSDGIEQIRFFVPEGTKIQRGIDDIMLDDLESDDTVTVQYYKASDGTLKAVSVVDSNIAASF